MADTDSQIQNKIISLGIFPQGSSFYRSNARYRNGHRTLIDFTCPICSRDEFTSSGLCTGVFTAYYTNFLKGQIPCRCNKKKFIFSEEQRKFQIKKRILDANLPLKFIDWDGGYRGVSSRFTLECQFHGMFKSNIRKFVMSKAGCQKCYDERRGELHKKPDEDMVSSFFASGPYSEGTIFKRSDRLSQYGWKSYWKYECSRCNKTGESYYGNLQAGQLSCDCRKDIEQNIFYINMVKDSDLAVALKIGITCKLERRITEQNRNNRFQMYNMYAFKFPSSYECIQFEKNIKQTFQMKYISFYDLEDGYTETLEINNLEEILEMVYLNKHIERVYVI